MKKSILILGSFILATFLGLFAQDITWFIESITSIFEPITYLTVITLGSYFFYILAYFLMFYGNSKRRLPENTFISFLNILFSFIGILVSVFSFFVLSMSGGWRKTKTLPITVHCLWILWRSEGNHR